MRFLPGLLVLALGTGTIQAERIVFSQLVFSPEWHTVVSVTNPSAESAELNLNVYGSWWATHSAIGDRLIAPLGLRVNGEAVCPIGLSADLVTCGNLSRTLGPGKTLRLDLTALGLVSGFLVLDSPVPVSATVRFDARVSGEIQESTGVVPNRDLPSRDFVLDVASTGLAETGLALVPVQVDTLGPTHKVTVGMALYDDEGNLLGERDLEFARQAASLVFELFPEVARPFRGHLVVRQTGEPVQAMGILLQFRTNGSYEYTSLPLTALADSQAQ